MMLAAARPGLTVEFDNGLSTILAYADASWQHCYADRATMIWAGLTDAGLRTVPKRYIDDLCDRIRVRDAEFRAIRGIESGARMVLFPE